MEEKYTFTEAEPNEVTATKPAEQSAVSIATLSSADDDLTDRLNAIEKRLDALEERIGNGH